MVTGSSLALGLFFEMSIILLPSMLVSLFFEMLFIVALHASTTTNFLHRITHPMRTRGTDKPIPIDPVLSNQ